MDSYAKCPDCAHFSLRPDKTCIRTMHCLSNTGIRETIAKRSGQSIEPPPPRQVSRSNQSTQRFEAVSIERRVGLTPSGLMAAVKTSLPLHRSPDLSDVEEQEAPPTFRDPTPPSVFEDVVPHRRLDDEEPLPTRSDLPGDTQRAPPDISRTVPTLPAPEQPMTVFPNGDQTPTESDGLREMITLVPEGDPHTFSEEEPLTPVAAPDARKARPERNWSSIPVGPPPDPTEPARKDSGTQLIAGRASEGDGSSSANSA